MTGGSAAERHRIGGSVGADLCQHVERRAGPRGAGGSHEGVALSGRFEVAFLGRRERQRKFVHVAKSRGIYGACCAPCGSEKHHVIAHGAVAQEIFDPTLQTYSIMDVALIDGCLDAMAVGKGTDGKGW